MSSKINFAANFCVVLSDFLKKGKWLGVVVLVLVGFNSSGQAPVVVSGTDFNATLGKEGQLYIAADNIDHYGINPGSLTPGTGGPPWMSGLLTTFQNRYQYLIINNPIRIDSTRFIDKPNDYMYVVSPITVNPSTILEYSVSDMVPNSDATVVINYCSVVDRLKTTTNIPMNCVGQQNTLRVQVNLQQDNIKYDQDQNNIAMGVCANVEIPVKVDASGQVIVRLQSNRTGQCTALGISKIEVRGQIKPAVRSEQGLEVCAGEQISLKPKVPYNGTYQWQWNNNGTWTNLGRNEAQSYEIPTLQVGETSKNYEFRYLLTPTASNTAIISDILTIGAIRCCEAAGGAASSRQTIFYDDFGTLDLATDPSGRTYKVWDYTTDPSAPKQITRTTTTPFRWPLAQPPIGHDFIGTPNTPLFDGEYAVAAYLTNTQPYRGIQGSLLQWASQVLGTTPAPPISYDHSGAPEGAALFINNDFNTNGSVIYRRDITNLCTTNGKTIYFECYIAVFTTSANGVDVAIRLTGGNAVVTRNAVALKQGLPNGGVWVRVSGEVVLAGNSLRMEVINNAPNEWNIAGNDLVIDDIKIMACAPPPIDAVFNLNTLSKGAEICKDINVISIPTDNFTKYYLNNPNYLYQWTLTPDDNTKWQNIGGQKTATTELIADPKTLAPNLRNGDKIYFRVVAALPTTFATRNNFQGAGNYANINDACRNYSVSLPIEGTIKCPSCNQPATVTIPSATPAITGAGAARAVTICQTGTANLTGAYTNGPGVNTNPYQFSWYKKGTVPAYINNIAVAFKPLTPADSGVWVLRVEDYNGVADIACYREDSVRLVVLKAITNNIIDSAQTICEGLNAKPLIQKVNTTIQGNLATPTTYVWQKATAAAGPFTDIAPAANEASFTPTAVNENTYFRRVAYAQGSLCPNVNSDPVLITVIPPITTNNITPATQTICSGTSPVVTGAAITGATYQWETSRTAAGTYTAIAGATTQDLPANPLINTVSGTTELYYFRRVAQVGNCPHTSAPVEVSVNGGMDGGRIATNQTICLGTTPSALTSVSLASGGTAPPIRYIWETSSDGTTWTPEGTEAPTNTSYTFAAAPTANTTLRRVAIGGTGSCDRVISNLVTITIVTPATATILTPAAVTSPATGQHTFNSAVLPVTATPAASGYTGLWALATKGALGSAASNATNTVTGMAFDDVSTLTWTVRDTAEVCPAAVATLTITRRNLTVADAKDDSLCITGLPRTVVGNGLITGETSSWSFVSAVPTVTTTWAQDPADAKNIIISAVAIPANTGKVELTFRYTVNSPLSTSGPSTKDVKITIYELTEAARVTLPTANTCDPTITLDGNRPQQPTAYGIWTKPATQQGTLTNPRLNNTTLTGLTQLATTTLTWTIFNHLCPSTTATKVVNATPPIYVQAELTGREVLCTPTDVVTYTGTTSNGGPVATYRFEVIRADGTLGTVQPTSTNATFTAPRGSLRNGDKIRLTVTADPNNGICFADGGIGKDSLFIDGYILQDTIVSNVRPDKMDTVCTGKSIRLCVPESRGNTAYQWYKDGQIVPSEVSTCIELDRSVESGDYSVRVTNSVCGIRSSEPRNIKIYDQPAVSFNPKEVKLDLGLNNGNNNTAVLKADTSGLVIDPLVEVEWSPDSLLTQPTSFNLAPTFTAPKSGGFYNYRIDVATGGGRVFCRATASISVKALPRIRIPNAFSPNDDGLNDTWQIDGIDAYPKATVKVFNRWGTVIYQDTPYGRFNEWKGTVDGGGFLPVATYYYVIDLNEKLEGQEETFNGPITIVR